jgi:hypothetical protein
MGEANDRRARGDNLAGLARDRTDDAIGVGPQRRIVDGVARQRDRAVSARDRGARLIGRRSRLVEIGVGRPALLRQRRQAPLFRFRLNERGGRGTLFRLRFLELEPKIGVVEPSQRVALCTSAPMSTSLVANLPAMRKARSLSIRALTTPARTCACSRGA